MMSNDINIRQKPTDLYELFSSRVKGSNINPVTLLATDYLNHFNEIIMLIEMLPDMPECIEDIAAWTPKSYQQHFLDSNFTDKELAIEAYAYAPARFRQPFERLIGQLDALIVLATPPLKAAVANEDQAALSDAIALSCEMRQIAEKAGAIINGEDHGHDQAEIDAVLES